jgi:serine/threonine protein kinase
MAKGNSAEKDPLVGTTIADKYLISGRIAQGGMGTVYRGAQKPLNRKVAVKVLRHQMVDTKLREIDAKRFLREASTVSQLSHPNTITLYDYGTLEADGLYFVMELLEGRTLGAVIARCRSIRWKRTLHIVRQICGSLNEAHRAGLAHRDLKPLNIMLIDRAGDSDFVKVLDFGLVKPVDEKADERVTEKGGVMGSPAYMSPEQVFNESVDQRSDIYSLGVIMFEMLMGRLPFRPSKGGGVREILKSHLIASPPTFMEVRPDLEVPPQLEFAVMRCLAKKPYDRFSNVTDLLNALDGLEDSTAKPIMPNPTAEFDMRRAVGGVSSGIQEYATTGPDKSRKLDLETNRVKERFPFDNEFGSKPGYSRQWLIVGGIGLLILAGIAVVILRDPQPATERAYNVGGLVEDPIAPHGQSNQPAPPLPEKPLPSQVRKMPPAPEPAVKTALPAPKPARVAKPRMVALTLQSKPSGAKVYQHKTYLGDTPLVLTRKAKELMATYQFRKRGYVSRQRTISRAPAAGAKAMTLSVKLTRSSKKHKKARKTGVKLNIKR